MDQEAFKAMWERMHREGYFQQHPHYPALNPDMKAVPVLDPDTALHPDQPDPLLETLDFSADRINWPLPYSNQLEAMVKMHEWYWLPAMFGPPQGKTLLDVGCGYGRSLEWMHPAFEQALGVDISDAALELARQRFNNIPSVRFQQSGGDGLPDSIQDESVDYIYCFTVFQHIPRAFTEQYLKDFHRVLTPEGLAVFNLFSGDAEDADSGPDHTEWRIGYGPTQIKELLNRSRLQARQVKTWHLPEGDGYWTWIKAGRNEPTD